MNSLFRNVLLRNKDSYLKESLQSQLGTCVKDIQLDYAHSGRFQSSSEAAEALCTVLEAIFIHGIKESFVDKVAMAMGDPDTRPEPDFWPALLVFSHRELIDQIGKLNFISSDIGRCRAWLRLSLNDHLLTSYLQSMLEQNSALNSFYKRSAYLRDTELVDMFVTLISSIEEYSFNFACNSSLLNMWTNQPLLMAGIWSPAMKSCPIVSGTDIAQSLTIEDSTSRIAEDSVSSVLSVASFYGSSLGSCALDEEEALKIILRTDVTLNQDQSEIDKVEENLIYSNTVDDVKTEKDADTSLKSDVIEANESTEHSATGEARALGLNKVDDSENNKNEQEEPSIVKEPKFEVKKHKLQSYHSLVESYNQTSTTTKMPDLQDLLQKYPLPRKPSTPSMISTDSDSDTIDKLGFEVVPESFDTPDIPEFHMLLQGINSIATEQGLDSQNYICRTCSQHVGINFGSAKVCGLTGFYYCSDCFGDDPANEYWVIPARIIYNWDFRRYSVSHRAAEFLSQVQMYPLFDVSAINPKIYVAVEEMAHLKELRERLNFLRAYLITCRENAIETLQKQMWPRDYLYEKLHLYSLTDLTQVPTGTLEGVLQKAVDRARTHVLSCTPCRQKGFICEICKDPKIIFPFDLDSTYRCKNCNAVYHCECLQAGQLCPKCLRIQQRVHSIQHL